MRRIGISIILSVMAACACGPRPLPERNVYLIGLSALVEVVGLRQEDDGVRVSYGSGSVVGYVHGGLYVLTAKHVVDAAEEIAVRVAIDGPWDSRNDVPFSPARLARKCHDCDLALLETIHALPRTPLSVASVPPRVADAIYWFGCADETPTVFGRGLITRLNYPGKGQSTAMQFGGMAWPGMSGGPLLDDHGRLVGVITLRNAVDDPENDGVRVTMEDVGYAERQDSVAAFLRRSGVIR